MLKGIIVKGIGGFYYVDVGDRVIECKARGNFRQKKLIPCVGDYVSIETDDAGKGFIVEISERRNSFIRPPVSNIDELIIVASVNNPSPDLVFIDKMLAIAAHSGVHCKICFNKSDLDDGIIKELTEIYSKIGYEVFVTSTTDNIGIESIRAIMKNKTVAFSGFSGVGKSSLLNAITNEFLMETGTVSERLKRGKHTTRHVELIKFQGGYIVDTPGFSMLDFPDSIDKDALQEYFPEFADFSEMCKFRNCNHMGSSNVCAVCNAAEKGDISESRFNNYKYFYDSLSQRKEWKK